MYLSVLVPSLFAPWAELLVDALAPAARLDARVDVASGPGTVARVIARRIGAIGRVYACDIDAAMLAADPAGGRPARRRSNCSSARRTRCRCRTRASTR